MRNSTCRQFEAKIRHYKRRKISVRLYNLQMLDVDNIQQAVGFMGRGESWVAHYVDCDNSVVAATVKAGPKLVEMIAHHFPELNPFASSVATVKAQGSAIAVEDEDAFIHWQLDCDRVSCRGGYGDHQGKRFLVVPPPERGVQKGEDVVWAGDGKVELPRKELIGLSQSLFEDEGFPDDDWFCSGNLQAFRELHVLTAGNGKSEPRHQLASITGWSSLHGNTELGQFVQISLPPER